MAQNPATYSGTPYGPLFGGVLTGLAATLAVSPNALIPLAKSAMPETGSWIRVTRGDGIELPFDVTFNNSPYDLTDPSDHAIWATFKSDPSLSDAQAEIQKTLAGGGITISLNVLTQVSNRLTISLVEADTRQFPNVKTYLLMDIQIQHPNAVDPQTIFHGTLEIIPEITLAS